MLALPAAPLPSFAYAGQALSKNVRINISEARAIALKPFPGEITGGLRYSFDIRHGKVVQEIGLDATGKVLENKKEGPNPD